MNLKLRFADAKPQEQAPNIALYLLDISGLIRRKVGSSKEGRIDIESELVKQGRGVVALGPDVDDPEQIPRESMLRPRLEDQLSSWRKTELIEIPRYWWTRWLLFSVCVSGRVRKCLPILYENFDPVFLERFAFPMIPWPRRPFCFPICNGVLEIYERRCCCRPPIVIDLPSIIEKLKHEVIVHRIPHPPPPPPDGILRTRSETLVGGKNRIVLRAEKAAEAFQKKDLLATPNPKLQRDLQALETLPADQAIEYFNARPYLMY